MNRIVLSQIDVISGDISYNSTKIINDIEKAKSLSADIVIFPEAALYGLPCGDVPLRHISNLQFQLTKLEEIAKISIGITVILGFINANNQNAIAVLKNGKIKNVFTKNEIGYISVDKTNYAIISGEYNENNSCENLKNINKDICGIIHCSSSPSRAGKERKKGILLSSLAKKYNINYIYVNQTGYGDNYSFDGASRIYNKTGKLTLLGKSFEEDFIVADDFRGKIEKLPLNSDKVSDDDFSLDYTNDLERIYKSIICAIRGYFLKTGFKKAVLGLSGGLDSTVCAVLLADALGKENVYAVSMPTQITSADSKNDAAELVKNLGINFIEEPIGDEVELFKEKLYGVFEKIDTDKYQKSTTMENIQARTRATILWSISNECKSMLPIATSDKSEAYIGYATTNGDMTGGFAPIADVTKTKLFALADFMNKYRKDKNVIPKSILEKPPGAELKFDESKGRTITAEEDNMPYPFLDEIIWYVENRSFGFEEFITHKFLYEKEKPISQKEKENWILKFFDKEQKATFKWHILPLSVIVDYRTINDIEYYQPIISKHFVK